MSKKLKERLNAQQRSVPQLPAQAHAKKINVLGSKTDPKHPFSGYMVGADESVERSAEPIQESPFGADHADVDQFVKEEWNTERTGDWTGQWDVSLNTPPNYRVKVKAPTAEFAVDTLRKRGMTGFKDATDDQIDISPITYSSMKEEQQPVNEGWNDFTVDGYRYQPWEEEDFDRDNSKIHHAVKLPSGETVTVDWDPYDYMEPGDLKQWIDLGMPKRTGIGPLNSRTLHALSQRKITDEAPTFAKAGKIAGGLAGAAVGSAIGPEGTVAGGALGAAAGHAGGRWLDKKIDNHITNMDEAAGTVYFFDVNKSTRSFTPVQLQSMGLKQSKSGKWYCTDAQAAEQLSQKLNVPAKPWNPPVRENTAADWPVFGNDAVEESVKQRLDPKCWKGKHKEGTKIKGGVRVNNCVPNESVEEAQHGLYYNVNKRKKAGTSRPASSPTAPTAQAWKDAANTAKKESVEEEWSKKYKDSINCSNPKGFSQKAHCAGKKKNESISLDEQFDQIEEMVNHLAKQHSVDADAIWEDFESVSDDELIIETAAWHRKSGKNKNGGLNKKGVASYRREHPGSKLQTAVTTKPSKLKPGSKAAKRRKSFCARMSGVKGPMKKPNGKPTRKALALRKWNCNEDIAEGLPGSLSKSDYAPGATKKHVSTSCTTCNGHKSMFKLDGKLFADNKKGAVKVKCPTCKGTGDKQGVKEMATPASMKAKNKAASQRAKVREDITKEDVISKLKDRLGDYLKTIGDEMKSDPDLKDRVAKAGEKLGPAVKTITTDSGEEISIHGNEDDGFRIAIKNKPATAKFKTVDEAAMACNMFNARRRNRPINTDYVDEQ